MNYTGNTFNKGVALNFFTFISYIIFCNAFLLEVSISQTYEAKRTIKNSEPPQYHCQRQYFFYQTNRSFCIYYFRNLFVINRVCCQSLLCGHPCIYNISASHSVRQLLLLVLACYNVAFSDMWGCCLLFICRGFGSLSIFLKSFQCYTGRYSKLFLEIIDGRKMVKLSDFKAVDVCYYR